MPREKPRARLGKAEELPSIEHGTSLRWHTHVTERADRSIAAFVARCKAYARPKAAVQQGATRSGSRNLGKERARLDGAAKPAQLLKQLENVVAPHELRSCNSTGRIRALGVKRRAAPRPRRVSRQHR
jgi:hypothetical protein